MAIYTTTITNKTFSSTADSDHGDDREAIEEAVQGTIAIAADEIRKGEPLFMAEITIECDGREVEHRAVAVGSSPLS